MKQEKIIIIMIVIAAIYITVVLTLEVVRRCDVRQCICICNNETANESKPLVSYSPSKLLYPMDETYSEDRYEP